MKRTVTFSASLCLLMILAFAPERLATGAAPPQGVEAAPLATVYKGVTLDYQNNTVYIVDASNNAVTGPYLSGLTTGLLDIVVTPDQNTAVVSAFSDKKVLIADISNILNPTVTTVDFSATPSSSNAFNPEDLAISVDGRYVVVSDGANNDTCAWNVDLGIASINIASRSIAQYLSLSSPKQAQSVSVDKYGNVFVGDYCNSKLYVVRLNSDGTLTDTGTEITLPFYPTNSYVSPDSTRLFIVGYGGVSIYQINGPGSVTKILDNSTLNRIQSMAFSVDGSKLFLGDYSTSPDRIIVANPNDLSTITTVNLLSDVTGYYYGVDVMAVTPDGQKLYMGNMVNGYGAPTNKLMEVNLNTYARTDITLGASSIPVATAFREYHIYNLSLPLVIR